MVSQLFKKAMQWGLWGQVLRKQVRGPPSPSRQSPGDGRIWPGNWGCGDQKGDRAAPRLLPQIEVKLSVKFTSREFSLKRMPSRKQTGVFGVKIAVVTK